MARPGLERHPKFVMFRAALGSRLLALGALESIWATCYETGDPRIGTPEMVEAIAGWAEAGQTSGKLFTALRDCGGKRSVGFIERDTSSRGRWQVHDLFDHAPDYVRKRSKREQERKGDRSTSGQRAPDRSVSAISGQPSGVGRTPAPAPAPAPNQESEKTSRLSASKPASKPQLSDGFARFWAAYPARNGRKVGKSKAWSIWRERKLETQVEPILTALSVQVLNKRDCEARKVFCPEFQDPHRWLRDARWQDEIGAIMELSDSDTADRSSSRPNRLLTPEEIKANADLFARRR